LLALIVALSMAEAAAVAPKPIAFDPGLFIERPSGMDLQRALERHLSTRAYAYGGALHATLSCAVKKDGGLGPCEVIEETPPGLGVAEVAMRLSREFKLPTEIGGESVEGGWIKIPMDFRPPSP